MSAPSPRAGLEAVSWRIEPRGEVDSTNTAVLERARRGEAEGLVVWAERQRGGRGRHGRSWHSPPGGGLYFSALLRPQIPPGRLAPLTLAAGVAMAEGVADITGEAAGLKWPNDLRLGGKKVGGILCEFEPRGGPPAGVVVGVGLNLCIAPGDFPPGIRASAASLLPPGLPAPAREEVLRLLLRRLEIWYKNFMYDGVGPVRRRWLELCDTLGQEVELSVGGRVLRGIVHGIDEGGRLLLRQADGSLRAADAGEVIET